MSGVPGSDGWGFIRKMCVLLGMETKREGINLENGKELRFNFIEGVI